MVMGIAIAPIVALYLIIIGVLGLVGHYAGGVQI